MKRIGIVLTVLLLLFLTGCAPEQPAQVVNPITSVTGPWDFLNILEFYLPTPYGAEDPSYSIISNEIAQIRYCYKGMDFTLRCAVSEEDISGVYGPFLSYDHLGILLEHRSGDFTVQTKYTTDGGALALWQIDRFRYSLFTPTLADGFAFDEYAASVAEKYLNRQYPSDYSEDYLSVVCGGETCFPLLDFAYSCSYDGENFIFADGGSNLQDLNAAGKLPVILYQEDFQITLAEGIELDSVILYGEDFTWLDQQENAAFLKELSPGTYFAGIVINRNNEYVPSEDSYTYSGYQCLFELIVE